MTIYNYDMYNANVEKIDFIDLVLNLTEQECAMMLGANQMLVLEGGKELDLDQESIFDDLDVDGSLIKWGPYVECTEMTLFQLCNLVRQFRERLHDDHYYLWTYPYPDEIDVQSKLHELIRGYFGKVTPKDPPNKKDLPNNCAENIGTCCLYTSRDVNRPFGLKQQNTIYIDCRPDMDRSDCLNLKNTEVDGFNIDFITFTKDNDYWNAYNNQPTCANTCGKKYSLIVSMCVDGVPETTTFSNYQDYKLFLEGNCVTQAQFFDNELDARNYLRTLKASGCDNCTTVTPTTPTPTPTEPPVTPLVLHNYNPPL